MPGGVWRRGCQLARWGLAEAGKLHRCAVYATLQHKACNNC